MWADQPQNLDFRLRGVQPERVRAEWPVLSPVLAPALRDQRGDVIELDLMEEIEAGKRQAFVVERVADGAAVAVVVTRILQYPRNRVVSIDFTAGQGCKDWCSWLRSIEEWARREGCTGAQIVGRRGWGRVTGYAHVSSTFYKEL